MTEKEIVENIKNSKKYKTVHIKTIQRIVADCVARFGEKRAEKEAKNLLHQIWGAFYETRPDFDKIYSKLDLEIKSGNNLRNIILPILKLQSSVKERITILEEFYQKIFEITGAPNSIIDHACGLNPLTIPWMNLPETTKYTAYDIDEGEISFLKSFFKKINNHTHATTRRCVDVEFMLGDLLCLPAGRQATQFDYVDVVFMLKLLPCLEHQKKCCSLEILKNQKCKFLVVSFPIKSIGGKNIGMLEFYRNSFRNMISSEKWAVKELIFDTELVYVIKKPACRQAGNLPV